MFANFVECAVGHKYCYIPGSSDLMSEFVWHCLPFVVILRSWHQGDPVSILFHAQR